MNERVPVYTLTWTVGALYRRQIRRALQRATGITVTEDKGWIDSQFTVKTTSWAKYKTVKAEMDRITTLINAEDGQ